MHAKAGDAASLLQSARASWHRFNPNEPFEYSFLDDDFQKNYEAENRLSAIAAYFTAMAILVSCLGLFALASFSAEHPIKEIGVRKVLGASTTGIMQLLIMDFLKLVGIAVVFASPVTWWIMHRWLENFAYKEGISRTVFALTAAAALLIALFTTSFQAVKAALANPVKSLGTE